MDIRMYLYFENDSGDILCTKCAIEQVIKEGKDDIEISGRDDSDSGNDMRSTPQCYLCGKYLERTISL